METITICAGGKASTATQVCLSTEQDRSVCGCSECVIIYHITEFLREHMDIKFANVLFKMWKLQAKT